MEVSTLTYNFGNLGFWICSTGWFKQNCFRSHCSPIVGWGDLGRLVVKVKQCSGATSWYIPATPASPIKSIKCLLSITKGLFVEIREMTKELFSTLNEILFNTLSPVHHQKILSFGFSDYNPPKPKLENEASVYEAFLHPPPKVEGNPWVLTHPLKSPPTHSVHTHTSPFPNPVSLIRLKFQTRCFRATSMTQAVYIIHHACHK